MKALLHRYRKVVGKPIYWSSVQILGKWQEVRRFIISAERDSADEFQFAKLPEKTKRKSKSGLIVLVQENQEGQFDEEKIDAKSAATVCFKQFLLKANR